MSQEESSQLNRHYKIIDNNKTMQSIIDRSSAKTTALNAAKGFIEIANADQVLIPETGETYVEGITHLKLQKMLYFAEAAHLAIYGTQLFNDEIEAWSLGPVVPNVYQVYRTFQDGQLSIPEGEVVEISDETKAFLKDMWVIFGKYTAFELVEMSHKHAPWKNVYRAGARNISISKESMMDFYRKTNAFSVK